MKKKILVFLRIIVSIILIGWIVYKVELNQIVAHLKTADLLLLCLAYLLLFAGHFLSILRWKSLLMMRHKSPPFFKLFQSYMIGIFFNNLLPSTIGGDSSRAYDSYKFSGSKAKGVAVIFIDRFLGFLALVLFALISVWFVAELDAKIINLKYLLSFSLIIMVCALFVLLYPDSKVATSLVRIFTNLPSPLSKLFQKIYNPFLEFADNKPALIKAFILSLILQFNVVLHYYLIAQAIAINISFLDYFFIIPITLFVTMIPLSVNGIGLRENTFVYLLTIFAVLPSKAVALAWIAYGFVIIQGIIGGMMFSVRSDVKIS